MDDQTSPPGITIPFDEYEELKERSEWLDCLDEAGVDNWEGIGEAQYIMSKRRKASGF